MSEGNENIVLPPEPEPESETPSETPKITLSVTTHIKVGEKVIIEQFNGYTMFGTLVGHTRICIPPIGVEPKNAEDPNAISSTPDNVSFLAIPCITIITPEGAPLDVPANTISGIYCESRHPKMIAQRTQEIMAAMQQAIKKQQHEERRKRKQRW